MDFGDLQRRLVDELRWRVQNGETTERGLARAVGVSQPHIHKVLKGSKILSLKFCDRIVSALGLTVFDLLDELDAERWSRRCRRGSAEAVNLDVLEGRLGPNEAWPHRIAGRATFAVSPGDIAGFRFPVAAQLGPDPRMEDELYPDEWVVLDQSIRVRQHPVQSALYLVRLRGHGLIRNVQVHAGAIYVVADDVRNQPSAWERVSVPSLELPRLIRARVHRVVREQQWPRPEPAVKPLARRPPHGTQRAPVPQSVAS